MPDLRIYLQATAVAALVSPVFVLTIVLAIRLVRRTASTAWLNAACALGLALAFGSIAVLVRLNWPPVSGLDRFFTIVVPLVLAVELIAGFPFVPRGVAWFLRISLAATIPRILLRGSVYLSGSVDDWPLWWSNATLAVSAVVLAGFWGLLSSLSQRSPGISIPLAIVLAIQCAGLNVMMAGYIKGGAAAFPMAATLAATTLVAWIITKRSSVPVILGIGVVSLFGVLFVGRFFGRLSTGCAIAMLLAPLLCWVTEMPLLRHRKPGLVGLLRLMLVAIPLVIVLTLAKQNFDRDMAPLIENVQRRMARPSTTGRRSGHDCFLTILISQKTS